MNARLAVIAAAAAAIVIAVIVNGGGSSGRHAATTGAPAHAPAGALTVTFPYSPEKEPLLRPVIARFNASGATVDGRRVFVDAAPASSGDVEAKIAKGTLKPAMWSPASSFWGRLLNYQTDRALVAADNPSLVRTPLVIAMWRQMARDLGYPRRPLTYKRLAQLATRGWAAVGKPAYGDFKFVHTNPDFSTAGLSAVAAQYYAAAGKREGLTVADVTNPRVRDQVAALEHSIVHYGDTTLFISDELKAHGTGYASAVAMEETTLLDFNRHAPADQQLTAVYPADGTFFSDSPLITLNAGWVTPAQRQAAKLFAAFAAKQLTPAFAGRYGFRPADPAAQPAGLVSARYGADPAQPTRELKVPEPKVLARIMSAWRAGRKPGNVLLVLDNSGSMGDNDKLNQAKAGLQAFLRQASPRDQIGLMKFSGTAQTVVPIATMRTNRAKLLDAISHINPESDTRLRDTTVEAVNDLQAHLDKNAINAVVLLTDGADTVSGRTADQVVAALAPQARKESGQIRLFTIAYGADANQSELARYARATGGKAFAAGTNDIEQVYRSISSFF